MEQEKLAENELPNDNKSNTNNKKKKIKVSTIILDVILGIVLLIAITIGIGFACGYKIGIVPTDSMEPTIAIGSLEIIAPVHNIQDVKEGDVLSYYRYTRSDTKKYIHRVISIDYENNEIVLKGDNPNTQEQADTIGFELVDGKQVLDIPGMGYFIAFIKNNFIVIVAALISLVILITMINLLRSGKEQKVEASSESASEQTLPDNTNEVVETDAKNNEEVENERKL